MNKPVNEWFQKTNSDLKLLDSVRDLSNQNEKWTLAELGLSDAIPSNFSTTANDATSLYSCTKGDAHQSITTLTQSDGTASAQDKAQSEAYLATNAFKNWKADRNTKNVRKAGAGLQKFLCTIGDFLDTFSGIAEIVKSADQQFGGLAYGTVVLLATVAVVKQRREETIEEVFEELALTFPRLNTLQELHPGPQLKRLIVAVFNLAIKFCRETILYFTRSKRVLKAMMPSETKLKTVSQLRLKLLEIRKECEVIVLQELEGVRLKLQDVKLELQEANVRLECIQSTNHDIKVTGVDTNVRVQENQLRLRQDAELKAKNEYLTELKNQLAFKNTDNIPLTAVVHKVKTVLEEGFSDRRRKGRGFPQRMTSARLMQNNTYSSWLDRESSAMLVLAGCNFGNSASIQLNWLSNASVCVVDSMRHTSHVLAAFCQTSYTVTRRNRRSFPYIIKSLICQLAEQHPSGLRSQHEETYDALVSPLWKDDDPWTAFEHMTNTLSKLIAHADDGKPVVIVIDRLDLCCWSDEPESEVNELEAAVSSLLHMLREKTLSNITIKILLVMDDVQAKNIPTTFEWAISKKLLECKVDWDQQTDEA